MRKLTRGLSFDIRDYKEQKDLFEPASIERAEEYFNRVRVKKSDGKSLGLFCDLDEFKQFGQGPYFYFLFLKYFMVVLIFVCLISLAPMFIFASGRGMGAKSQSNYILALSVGNLKSNKLLYSESILLANDQDWENNKKIEYRRYSRICIWSDFSYSLLLIIFCYWLRFYQKKVSWKVDALVKSAKDYTLEVSNFPENTKKEDLMKYFQQRFNHRINQINFAFKFNNTLDKFVDLSKLFTQKNYVKAKYKTEPKRMGELLKSLDDEIIKLETELRKRMPHIGNTEDEGLNLSALKKLKAFIIFEMPYAPRNVKKIYDKKMKNGICGSTQTAHLFKGKKLKLNFPDHPDNIKWENLEISKCNKLTRTALVVILSLILMLACFIFIFLLNIVDAQSGDKNSTCSDRLIKIEELYLLSSDSTSYEQLRYCFCKDQSLIDLIRNDKISSICSSYLNSLIIDIGFSILGGMIIAVTNWILKKILKLFTNFQKYNDLTLETSSTATKGLIAAYLNTVVVSILSSAEFPNNTVPSRFVGSIFGIDSSSIPRFSDFYREWYQITGFKIAAAVFFSCFIPHVPLMMIYPITRCIKWVRARTKKVQIEMNEIVRPTRFDLAHEYVSFLNALFVCLTFSGGMPLLLVFLLVCIFCLYWTNKFYFVKDTMQPSRYNTSLTETITAILPLSIILHLSMSIWIYGVSEIFPNQNTSSFLNKAKSLFSNTDSIQNGIGNRIQNTPGLVILLVLLLVAILVEHFMGRVFRWVTCYSDKDERDKEKLEVEEEEEDTTQNANSYTQISEEIRKYTSVNYDLRQNDRYKPILLLFDKYN